MLHVELLIRQFPFTLSINFDFSFLAFLGAFYFPFGITCAWEIKWNVITNNYTDVDVLNFFPLYQGNYLRKKTHLCKYGNFSILIGSEKINYIYLYTIKDKRIRYNCH